MIERIKDKLDWSSLSRVERLALLGSVSIWLGVLLFAAGLVLAIRNYRFERQAMAQVTAIASLNVERPIASPTSRVDPQSTPSATPVPPTATPTLVHYAVGWATATPTLTPWATATPDTNAWPVLRPRTSPTPSGSSASGQLATVPNAPTPTPTPVSGPPDRIVIPSIDLDAPIVPIGWYIVEDGGHSYMIWQVADNAVSWHKTSAYPGRGGNVVLNGHHNIRGEVFRSLVDVAVGDRVWLYVGDQAYHYVVDLKMILKEKGEPLEVRWENASWIQPTDSERLTMVTCWPYTSNTHRLVVTALPAPAPPTGGITE
jgi:sortase A